MLKQLALVTRDVQIALETLLDKKCECESSAFSMNMTPGAPQRIVWNFLAKDLPRPSLSVWGDFDDSVLEKPAPFKFKLGERVTLIINDEPHIVFWTHTEGRPCCVAHIARLPLEEQEDWVVGLGCGKGHGSWRMPIEARAIHA